ncbi:response regulator transcription factor [Deinococcus koreensis]|uniref:response regulator transcription factor n=1 Tax=Deinococcus koreensis TaxID=2054903 RepID=UPI0013FDF828|nr:response regulator transcription factor [Deinococcus koreensis]
MSRLRISLVEDERFFRELLTGALSHSGAVSVQASLESVDEALRDPAIGHSDAVLVDIDLAGEDGIALCWTLRHRHPSLGIVLLSNHAHIAFAHRLISAELSGWGYLLKKSVQDLRTVLRAITAVAAGQVVLDPQLAALDTVGPGRHLNLSSRQRAMWALITQGYSNAAIAEHLGVSVKVIDNAVGGLYAALDIDARDPKLNARVSAALRYAREAQQANLTIITSPPRS